jgi:hypothetical protein
MASFTKSVDGYPLINCEGRSDKLDFWPVRYKVEILRPHPLAEKRANLRAKKLFDQGYRCKLTFYSESVIYNSGVGDCYDETQSFSVNLKTPDALKALTEGFKKCTRERQVELEECEKKAQEERELAKRIFPIKGSAAPTNPWKKSA